MAPTWKTVVDKQLEVSCHHPASCLLGWCEVYGKSFRGGRTRRNFWPRSSLYRKGIKSRLEWGLTWLSGTEPSVPSSRQCFSPSPCSTSHPHSFPAPKPGLPCCPLSSDRICGCSVNKHHSSLGAAVLTLFRSRDVWCPGRRQRQVFWREVTTECI